VQLNPLEEAAAYQQLLDDFEFTQEELAERIGKSRPSISNSLRLLTLSPALQRKVAAGVLSAGHAKAILALDDRAAQERIAEKVVNEGMSVRGTEELVRYELMESEAASSGVPGPGRSSSPGRSGSSSGRGTLTAPGLVELQDDLSDALMARVKISMGARRGRIQIEFGSVDDLERIVGVIANGLGGTPSELGGAG
jgi:ParB family transcriptional regulator, chromosome partitioning protein